MGQKIKKALLVLLIVLLNGGIFLSGFYNGVKWGWQANLPSPFEKIIHREKPPDLPPGDMSIFWDTWKVILDKYVDRQHLDSQTLIEGATKGLVKSLQDPYSEFLDSQQAQDLSQELSGEFSGVGMEIEKKGNFLIVVTPLPGTPAAKAGLRPNDKILEIDGQPTSDLSTLEAAKLIRGPEGTEVQLLIYRNSLDKPKLITLKREKIIIPSVRYQMLDDKIGYLRIYNFNQPLLEEFYQKSLKLLAQKPQKLILDLRNNPGGYLEYVVNVSGWFLNKGDIVLREKTANNEEKIYRAQGPGLFKDIPTVILVNQGTASAAEILAGALRDNRGLKLIGKKTFGKGSVQELVHLKDGNVLKITIARWFTPQNVLIEKNGLEPDIKVKNEDDISGYGELNIEKDKQLLRAMQELSN